jgi:leader peptidase (prepilin peptidase)/N-methyltransferase
MALLLCGLTARIHPGLFLAATCWLAICAVPLSFIDAAVRRLPDPLTATAYVGTVVLLALAAASGRNWGSMGGAVLGGIALAASYLVLGLIAPGEMGLGDLKASASIGTILAWGGYLPLVAGALAGSLLALIYSITLFTFRRPASSDQIPFGSFMFAGAFAVLIIGGR